MRKRYVTRSFYLGFDEDVGSSSTADEVVEDDKEPEFSGLLDAKGERLYRHRETVPFGFISVRAK